MIITLADAVSFLARSETRITSHRSGLAERVGPVEGGDAGEYS